MTLKGLNYLLTGEEEPRFTNEREKAIINKCLQIINSIEQEQVSMGVVTHTYGQQQIEVLEGELTEGIKICRSNNDMHEKSWGYESGVLISGHEAEYLLTLLKAMRNKKIELEQ